MPREFVLGNPMERTVDRVQTWPDSDPFSRERTVRTIFELSNRGLYDAALAYYLPDATVEVAGGSISGTYSTKEALESVLEIAIKEYGQPRVELDEIHVVGSKVYVESSTRLAKEGGGTTISREIHVLTFSGEKIAEHRVYANVLVSPRLQRE